MCAKEGCTVFSCEQTDLLQCVEAGIQGPEWTKLLISLIWRLGTTQTQPALFNGYCTVTFVDNGELAGYGNEVKKVPASLLEAATTNPAGICTCVGIIPVLVSLGDYGLKKESLENKDSRLHGAKREQETGCMGVTGCVGVLSQLKGRARDVGD